MSSYHYRIKSGKKGAARPHSAYIERSGRYSDREDLVASGHGNLPTWAENSPAVLWKAADTYERKNGAAYREHEIALPNELSTDGVCALGERLAQEIAGTRPYQYAIHSTVGELAGETNPHMHLMVSDRLPDEFDRPADRMFARFNAKQPELGGCRKASGGRTRMELRDEVIALRRKVADIQNEVLAASGLDARVDHRSLAAQGKAKSPERHLGPARVRSMTEEQRSDFASSRSTPNP